MKIQDLPLIKAVRKHAAEGREEKYRQELERRNDTELGAGIGELEHQPVLTDCLHPCATKIDCLSGEVQAIVADFERTEDLIVFFRRVCHEGLL